MPGSSYSAGDLLTAAMFNLKLEGPLVAADLATGAVEAAKIAAGAVGVAALAIVPRARAYATSTQSIADLTYTALALDAERWDTDTCHDAAVNNSRLTCRTAGLYYISAQAGFATNATGQRQVAIRLNGATFIAFAAQQAPTTGGTLFNVGTQYALAVNDYVELVVWQNSGAALLTNVGANYAPEFSMIRLSA